jgi:hypothetical protein
MLELDDLSLPLLWVCYLLVSLSFIYIFQTHLTTVAGSPRETEAASSGEESERMHLDVVCVGDDPVTGRRSVPASAAFAVDNDELCSRDDLSHLQHLSEPNVVRGLSLRFSENQIYTFAGAWAGVCACVRVYCSHDEDGLECVRVCVCVADDDRLTRCILLWCKTICIYIHMHIHIHIHMH